jgi:hypothetical protein
MVQPKESRRLKTQFSVLDTFKSFYYGGAVSISEKGLVSTTSEADILLTDGSTGKEIDFLEGVRIFIYT